MHIAEILILSFAICCGLPLASVALGNLRRRGRR